MREVLLSWNPRDGSKKYSHAITFPTDQSRPGVVPFTSTLGAIPSREEIITLACMQDSHQQYKMS